MKPAIECLHSKAFTLKMKCSYPHVRTVKQEIHFETHKTEKEGTANARLGCLKIIEFN